MSVRSVGMCVHDVKPGQAGQRFRCWCASRGLRLYVGVRAWFAVPAILANGRPGAVRVLLRACGEFASGEGSLVGFDGTRDLGR